MNVKQINVEYLSPSRTIETYSSTGKEQQDIFFIYNYDGLYFRIFKGHHSLIQFFQYGIEPEYAFGDEAELDEFLVKTF